MTSYLKRLFKEQPFSTSHGIDLEKGYWDSLKKIMADAIYAKDKASTIIQQIKDKDVLDLGCIGHTIIIKKSKSDDWLHAVIKKNAKTCMGVDYLDSEVRELQAEGWNIITQDVTALNIGKKFDVIVAGDLIEHLVNFEGFFESVKNHLRPGGELIISTPNSFSFISNLFLFIRGLPLINPDHVCSFDPKTLMQLASRFGFHPSKLIWIRSSWKPSQVIFHCTKFFGVYDFFTGYWSPTPKLNRFFRFLLQRIILYPLNYAQLFFAFRMYFSSDFVMIFRCTENTSKSELGE